VERRSPVPDLVTLGRLDLDDLGAVIGKNLCAVGAAKDTCQIDNLEAGECTEGGLR